MPLISVKTSAASPNGAALLSDLSSTLASLLGKPERYVMTLLEDRKSTRLNSSHT